MQMAMVLTYLFGLMTLLLVNIKADIFTTLFGKVDLLSFIIVLCATRIRKDTSKLVLTLDKSQTLLTLFC